jgi:hypothetical protein
VCSFERIDCLDDEPVLLQLLHEVQANKVILDIGGDRGLPALTSILDALERVSIDWIFVKSQLMLEAAILHLARHFPVRRPSAETSALAESSNNTSDGCAAAGNLTIGLVVNEKGHMLPQTTGGCIAQVCTEPEQHQQQQPQQQLQQQSQHPQPQQQQQQQQPQQPPQQQEKLRLDKESLGGAQNADAAVGVHGAASSKKTHKRQRCGTDRPSKKHRGTLPAQLLWRWKAHDMPLAWDLTARDEAYQGGLVREGLAVVLKHSEWWAQQV